MIFTNTDSTSYYLKNFENSDCAAPFRLYNDFPQENFIVREYIIREYIPVSINTNYDPCLACSNNPINGGSGVCFCTLGNKFNITY